METSEKLRKLNKFHITMYNDMDHQLNRFDKIATLNSTDREATSEGSVVWKYYMRRTMSKEYTISLDIGSDEYIFGGSSDRIREDFINTFWEE